MSNYNKKINDTCFENFISDLEKNDEFENSPIFRTYLEDEEDEYVISDSELEDDDILDDSEPEECDDVLSSEDEYSTRDMQDEYNNDEINEYKEGKYQAFIYLFKEIIY